MPQATPISARDELLRQQAMVLKALANPTRLKLVERLLHGPSPVGDLTDLIESDRSTVSKHLGVLRAHGIVRDRREAGVVVYELCTPCVANVFACTQAMLVERTTLPVTRSATARAGVRTRAAQPEGSTP